MYVRKCFWKSQSSCERQPLCWVLLYSCMLWMKYTEIDFLKRTITSLPSVQSLQTSPHSSYCTILNCFLHSNLTCNACDMQKYFTFYQTMKYQPYVWGWHSNKSLTPYAHSPLTIFVDKLAFGQKPVINYGEKTMVE